MFVHAQVTQRSVTYKLFRIKIKLGVRFPISLTRYKMHDFILTLKS